MKASLNNPREFHPYPSIPHLTVLPGNVVRSDKILSQEEQSKFLSDQILIEEKIDGANVGISFDEDGAVRLQNRNTILIDQSAWQWGPLFEWLIFKSPKLLNALADRYILFGEWCYAVHSIYYDSLPDWFLGFDIYDTDTARFLDVDERNQKFMHMDIHSVPRIAESHFTLDNLVKRLERSKFSNEEAEGIVLRRIPLGDGIFRAKLVRPNFIQNINEHWTKRPRRINKLRT
jgi:hypothetical protein